MLARILQASLRHARVVVVLTVLLLLYGVQQLHRLPLEVFPEFAPALFSVQLEAPGLTASQVEVLVTRPLESLLGGTNGVVQLRSESIQGLSVIQVAFAAGDPARQRQNLVEQLSTAATVLPPGSNAPSVSPLTSATMDLLKVGFVTSTRTPIELREFVQWTVRPRLLAVPGIARAAVYGGAETEYSVQVRPEMLAAYGLAISDLVRALNDVGNVRGLGFQDSGSQRLAVAIAEDGDVLGQIADLMIQTATGQALRLGEIAVISQQAAPAFGDALINGEPGVLVAMASQYGANTLDLTLAVESVLADLQPLLAREQIILVPALHRPANFISAAFTGLRSSLLLGAILCFVVLLLALRSGRMALVSFLSIPLSLLAAVLVLQVFGVGLNTMTLGGLAVAIGVVVDDAVIDVVNIDRRLRLAGAGASVARVVFEAAMEVRKPVVFATAVVMLVFLPILTLADLQGAFFRPLALAFLLAVGASLLVALTVTPALGLLLLRPRESSEPRWLAGLHQLQTRCLTWIAPRLWLAGLFTTVLAVAALVLLVRFDRELLPSFNEGHVVAQIVAPADTGLEATRRLGQRMSKQILKVPGVHSVELQLGRAEAAEDTWGVNQGEFHIALRASGMNEQAQAIAQIREIVSGQPGVESEVTSFLGDRIGEAIAGSSADVVITLFGTDLDALDRAAEAVAEIVRALPNAADVRIGVMDRSTAVVITPKPEAMARSGIQPGELADLLKAVHQGLTISQIATGDRQFPLVLHLSGLGTPSSDQLRQLTVRGAQGRATTLEQIATISLADSRSVIEHESGLRRQLVTANPDTTDQAGFVRLLRAALEHYRLPDGLSLRITGAAAAQSNAAVDLARNCAVALVLMIVLLIAGLGDARRAGLVLLAAPFAMIGAAAIVTMTSSVLSLGALVGLVSLFGITSRNAILLLAHLDHLVAHEQASWSVATAIRAAHERLLPVVLTSGLAALGLLPVALSAGVAGQEIEGPMARVILGGIASATPLCLLLLPLLAVAFLRPPAPAIAAESNSANQTPAAAPSHQVRPTEPIPHSEPQGQPE